MLDALTDPESPYDDPLQRHDAAVLGMWFFLGSEIMLFGGLFLALTVYRVAYPAAFEVASHHTDLVLGGINTAVLLTSSLSMALAVRAARSGGTRSVALLLALTAALGVVFLALKFTEYAQHIAAGLWPGAGFHIVGADEAQAQLFFRLYFIMTGLHALHLAIGVVVVTVLAILAWRKAFRPFACTPVEVGGLYWHLIDIVWIFLFPMLYLIGHR